MFPFSETAYQWMKWLAMVCVPALTAFVGAVGTALGWDAVGIATTITAATGVLIGTLAGVSSAQYHKDRADGIDKPERTD